MTMSASAFVLAAPHSGSGKTTIASLICLALRHRGQRVQPFKIGPDYLDPTHLSRAAGLAACNLDTFLLSESRMKTLYARAARGADVCVLEGVMGLYDGRNPLSDEHSTAHLARLLDLPVVLVIDASGMSRTVAAIATGLAQFGNVRMAGVILNRVGSERHAMLCEQALQEVGLPVFGWVAKNTEIHLPARHLGLLSAEQASWDETAALAAAQHLRLDQLLTLRSNQTYEVVTPPQKASSVQIAYAYDEAFHFYYPDALEELRIAGATLIPFSPLRDAGLPPADALLLGGGYPEAHAQALSENHAMKNAIRAFAESGQPVVGECGGLMYLGSTLRDESGSVYEMTGVIPYHTRMVQRVILGYREATALTSSPLMNQGSTIHGHEFHYSVLCHEPIHPAYSWQTSSGETIYEGYAKDNIFASYLHLHYAGFPQLAQRFIDTAQATL